MIQDGEQHQPRLDVVSEATRKAAREQVAMILTEPMTLGEIAEVFRLGKPKARTMLDHMKGVERVGSSWRIPLWKMTPEYLSNHGFL